MRRLLIVPALFLLFLGAPVFATESTQAPPTTTTDVPVAGGEAVSAGWKSAETPVPGAEVLGVTWDGDPAAVFAVEVRSGDGSWQPAESLGADDTGADVGTADAAQAATTQGDSNATEPIWAPDTTAVRVTLQSGEASGVTIAAVDSNPAAAPSGAAGASSGILPVLGGPDRYVFALVLLAAAVLLGACAFGFSPWRRNRSRRIMLLVALARSCSSHVHRPRSRRRHPHRRRLRRHRRPATGRPNPRSPHAPPGVPDRSRVPAGR